MTRISDQLERLRRHHESLFNKPDRIALYDMAHTLRVFTEIRDADLGGKVKRFTSVSPSPSKAAKRLLKSPHLLVRFPTNDPLVTKSPPGGKPSILRVDRIEHNSFSIEFKLLKTGELLLGGLLLRDGTLEDTRRLANMVRQKKVTYSEWMGSQFVSMKQQQNGDTYRPKVSRIIRDSTNAMIDASHFVDPTKLSARHQHLQSMLMISVSGYPLLYVLLMYFAQTILKKLAGPENTTSCKPL